jgi:hypothetical protein
LKTIQYWYTLLFQNCYNLINSKIEIGDWKKRKEKRGQGGGGLECRDDECLFGKPASGQRVRPTLEVEGLRKWIALAQ